MCINSCAFLQIGHSKTTNNNDSRLQQNEIFYDHLCTSLMIQLQYLIHNKENNKKIMMTKLMGLFSED
jgi:hypothetical protein